MGKKCQLRRLIVFAAIPCLMLLTNLGWAETPRPNIILMLADDLGAETIGVYGGESYQTPNLDQLANNGVRFNYGHAQPLCTPSRVKIMTGQYNFRNYKHFGYLGKEQETFAHLLSAAGYRTMVAGKWQLFNNRFEKIEGSLPEDAGFEESLIWQRKNEDKGSRYWAPLLSHDGKLRQHDAEVFGPDVFNRYVLDYIETHRNEAFFIYYPMVLTHDPWVTTPDMRNEQASDQEKFAAMMHYMDKMVGNVRSKVQQLGLAERTLILFIGDNGTDRDITSTQNGKPIRGGKGKTTNTGSLVPFIAWGPGLVRSNGVSSSLVSLNDVLPTLTAVAGVPVPGDWPVDGESLLPVLRGEAELGRESLFIHYEPRWPSGKPARYALDQRWKLYDNGGFYDTVADPDENSALDVNHLDAGVLTTYNLLHERLHSMPGELKSTRRWIPPIAYYLAGAALLALCALAYLLWRFFGKKRH